MEIPSIQEEEDEFDEPILFHQEDTDFELPTADVHAQWIQRLIQAEKARLSQLNFIFCSDEALLKINIEYLNHDTYTDIITFPYANPPEIEGDIFISIDRVKENAAHFGHSFEEELRRVMSHGVLHLCGYGDKTAEEKKQMRKKEEEAMLLF